MKGIMPPTLETLVKNASEFNDSVFASINELIQRPTSTSPSDAEIGELAKSSNVSEDDLRYFFSFLAFLFTQTEDIPEDKLQETLVEFIADYGEVENADRLASKLASLLAHRSVQDAAAKQARLRDGLLPNIVGLANFVDLRSDFKRDNDGNLTGDLGDPVSIVQLGIKTNSSNPHEREFLLQLDGRALDKLDECIKEIRKKLDILSKK